MYEQLYSFFEQNDCLYNFQFGFRHKHSTTHTMVKICDQIQKAIDKGQFAYGVFIDLQKAFDTRRSEAGSLRSVILPFNSWLCKFDRKCDGCEPMLMSLGEINNQIS